MVLPSRFQIGETVRYNATPCVVTKICFTESKVSYVLDDLVEVDSCDVEPL